MPDADGTVYLDSTTNAGGHHEHFDPGAEVFFALIAELRVLRDAEVRRNEIEKKEIALERAALAQMRRDLEARVAEFQETTV